MLELLLWFRLCFMTDWKMMITVLELVCSRSQRILCLTSLTSSTRSFHHLSIPAVEQWPPWQQYEQCPAWDQVLSARWSQCLVTWSTHQAQANTKNSLESGVTQQLSVYCAVVEEELLKIHDKTKRKHKQLLIKSWFMLFCSALQNLCNNITEHIVSCDGWLERFNISISEGDEEVRVHDTCWCRITFT